ncbi:hypothetical protein [Mesorhizobium huakuii]|uniref:Uncharacterized protein n=1 Tax=Mesorhizobium huakuii TaxID=28104 RepID=A0ABZ0VTE7_9HYPH|nr:hypothetical protein [Mesorhizobium huakuii]WQC00464.1 hypothetical protein U0R22_004670 [Mesorhizobium huakuii]
MELRRKTLGGRILQAVIDQRLDASPHQGELHLPGVFLVGLSHDCRHVVGNDGLAEARRERVGVGCYGSNRIFDVHSGDPHQKNDADASPRGDGGPSLLFFKLSAAHDRRLRAKLMITVFSGLSISLVWPENSIRQI